MKTKHTQGEWSFLKTGLNETCIFSDIDMEHIFKINHNEITGSQAEANAKLIADAGTTASKCGLLPSELLEQRNELLEALQIITNRLPLYIKNGLLSEEYKFAKQAIKKATE